MTRTFDDSQQGGVQETHSSKLSSKRSLLLPNHTATAYARPTIPHSQLRHLVTCPQRRGIVYFVSDKSIVERDLLHPHLPARNVISFDFHPTCFSATTIPSNPHAILFAAGGQQSQLHISLHSFSPAPTSPPSDPNSTFSPDSVPPPPKQLWKHNGTNSCGAPEIVNTIMFTPTSLTDDTRRSGSSASDIRMVVGGNNRAVQFYDIILQPNTKDSQRMQLCGQVILETCVNHVSISPNGRTLLCVGDTSKVYLYHLSPGNNVTFFPIATYDLPRPSPHSYVYTLSPTTPPYNFRSIACFSSAWSPDCLKFAVGSQEGQLCVWDVRSAWPIFQYWTPYRVNHKWKEINWDSMISGYHGSTLEENGPDSGIRSVKFTGGESGRELLLWVEQTTNLHVIDARTFDLTTHSIVPFPDLSHLVPTEDPARPSSPSPSLVELSSASSTDSLVEPNSSRTTTETGTGTAASAATTAVTDTTNAAHSRRAEAGSFVRVFTRTPSPQPHLPPPPQLQPPTHEDPASASSLASETDAWLSSVSRLSSAPSNISHILRPPGDTQRRRERLSRQRMSIMEQIQQREGSGSPGPSQPQQQQQQQQPQQQRRDTLNDVSSFLSSRSMALRRERVEAMSEAHRNDRGIVLSRSLRALSNTREEISAEIRTLIDDTRARIAALNGGGGSGNNSGNVGGVESPQSLRLLAEEFGVGDVPNSADNMGGGANTIMGPVQISGLCLDPTGGWVYVAGSTGIVEWRVREREEGRGGASSSWV